MPLPRRSIVVPLLLIFVSAACTVDISAPDEIDNTSLPTDTLTPTATKMLTRTPTQTATPASTATSVAQSVFSDKVIAYTSFSRSGIDIFIRNPSGEKIKLSDGNKMYFLPYWSNDGENLAFFSYEPFEESIGILVCVAPLLPENCNEVVDGLVNAQEMTWSSDNRYIYFSDVQSNGAEMDVYSLNVESGQITNLTRSSPVWDDSPSASKIEDRITFVSDRDEFGKGMDEIWIMAGDGSRLERLTFNHEFFWEDTDPVFSPDGNSIAFYRFSVLGEEYPGGIPGIWIIDLSTREERLLYEYEGMMFSDPPRWSPDGKYIVFNTGGVDEMDLQIVSVQDGVVLQLTNFPGLESSASWSSDSKWILFTHKKDDGNSLYLISKDGSIVEQVDVGGDVAFGIFSP